MDPLVYEHANLLPATRETKRVFHHVRGAVRKEARYLRRNWRKLIIKSTLLAGVLGIEYFIALFFLTSLIWDHHLAITAWIALIVPITAFAAHLLIAEGQETVLARLRAYALTGVLVLPIAMSLGLAINVASNAIIGDGSTITGSIGGVQTDLGSGGAGTGVAEVILNVLGAISPLLLVVAYAAALGISFYVAHKLFVGIELLYNKIDAAVRRKGAVERIHKDFEATAKQQQREIADYRALKRKIPDHLEERFADELFVAATKTIRDMRRYVGRQRHGLGPRDLFEGAYDQTFYIPEHIIDADQAYDTLDDIRDKLRPHAVITALGAAPVKWET